MTPDEYLDPDRFPLTTGPGLTLRQQLLADAAAFAELITTRDRRPLTPAEVAAWDELAAKRAVAADLAKDLDRRDGGAGGG